MATRKTAPKKTVKTSAKRAAKPTFAANLRNQAQDIWLSGLGAFANMQEQGNQIIENLMAQSKNLQGRVVESADDVKARVEARIANVRDAEVAERMVERLSKLGHVVETRATSALSRAGIATKKDVQTLSRRVSKLGAEVEKLAAAKKVAAKTVKPAAKPVAKSAVKRAAKVVVAAAAETAAA